MGTAEQHGWRIAEVERLVSLSRRDIQRACYQGRGGAGVLTPSDSSWGRRTYDERDLATLFLLAQRRREGLTLSQAADDLRERLRDHSQQELLALEAEKLSDRLADAREDHAGGEGLDGGLGQLGLRRDRSPSRTLTTARKSWAARRVALNARLRRQMTRPARNCFKN